jgi:hypothetical protein
VTVDPACFRTDFLVDMRYLYPAGPANIHQQRDLLRCYTLGWLSCLDNHCRQREIEAWTELYGHTVALDWMPDASWQWW